MYVDEVDVDEEGIAEMLMDDNAVAQLPRQYIIFYFRRFHAIVESLLHFY